jgi:hypothetical protein
MERAHMSFFMYFLCSCRVVELLDIVQTSSWLSPFSRALRGRIRRATLIFSIPINLIDEQ